MIVDEGALCVLRFRSQHAPWLAMATESGEACASVKGAPGKPALMRSLFAQAASDAARGVVTESALAAAVLRDQTRWTACVASPAVSEALLALFDPTCAVAIPAPPSQRPPA